MHVTNMLMLSCLVYDFCRKVTTACDQHCNVIMSRVRLLSESHDSMWPTCWYYHVSCTTSVGTLPCWSHAVVTFRQKSYTRHDNINMLVTCCHDFPTEVECYHVSCTTSVEKSRQHVTNMLMLSCLVYDFCRKDTTGYDQHVNVIMSPCCRDFPTEVVHETW
jgi:small nuclear ribonucleoprotein (snRNP)-like protein